MVVIWGLLFFNGLAYQALPMIVHLPSPVGKMLTQGALGLALLLVFTVNRKQLFRPNIFLTLFSILAVTSLMMSVRGQVGSGLGSTIRAVRLVSFLSVMWMLTPWWGRSDRVLVRAHLRCLLVVCGSVLLGLALAPGKALSIQGRLSGTIWPIPPPQVAHYAAVIAGLGAVLWLSGAMRRGHALGLIAIGTSMLLLSHTRTALLGLLAGVVVGGLSLLAARRRVRRAVAVVLVVVPIAAFALAPAISGWFARGQSGQELSALSGRTQVWSSLVHTPRPTLNRWLGNGLSNKSFQGLPIDNSWLAVYLDQGLFGDIIIGSVLLFLLITAAFRPPGTGRAVAIFLIVYCAVASYTETGLGDVSPYLLDLTVAASLLVPTLRTRNPGRSQT
jgi:hypothetical protein